MDIVVDLLNEMRAPLTNIIGFSHFLSDTKTGPLNDRQIEYLCYVVNQTNELLEIINHHLDLLIEKEED